MNGQTAPTSSSRRFALLASLSVVGLFVVLRIVLAFVRDPFFDELFTVWIARKPFGALLDALRHDSGPPLYYLIVKLAGPVTGPSIDAARAISLVVSILALIALLREQRLGPERWIAGLLVAVTPAHLYFSTEARSYALCGTFVAIAMIALSRWHAEGRMGALAGGSAALLLAAYSHYYGVLFFPLPFLLGVDAALAARRGRDQRAVERAGSVSWRSIIEGCLASALLLLLFVPGFRLAFVQPAAAAMRWMDVSSGSWRDAASALFRASVAGRFESPFLPPLPPWMVMLASALVAALLLFGLFQWSRSRLYVLFTITPVVLAIAFALAGKRIYFPLRFEAVLAIPCAFWLAAAIERTGRWVRPLLIATLIALGLTTSLWTILSHASSPPDSLRRAALFVHRQVDPEMPIVAGSFAWLEIASRIGAGWSPTLYALPAEQALHPGWRAIVAPSVLERDLEAIDRQTGGRFIWVGERASPELGAIARTHRLRQLFGDGPLVVAYAERR